MRKLFFATIFALASIPYSFTWGYNTPDRAYFQEKPFVYRTLLPSLAHYLPFDFSTDFSILVFLSCVGLGALMYIMYEKYWKQSLRNDVALIVSFISTLLILEAYKKYYDVPTAFLCLATYVLWIENKKALAVLAFTLLCLNRETAILLLPVLFLANKNAKYILAMMLVYAATRWIILWAYSDAAGLSMHMNFWKSFIVYATHPFMTIALVLAGYGIIMFFLARFPHPNVMSYVLWFIPVLTGLYMVAGYPFEIRVFAEVLPLLFMGAFLK